MLLSNIQEAGKLLANCCTLLGVQQMQCKHIVLIEHSIKAAEHNAHVQYSIDSQMLYCMPGRPSSFMLCTKACTHSLMSCEVYIHSQADQASAHLLQPIRYIHPGFALPVWAKLACCCRMWDLDHTFW